MFNLPKSDARLISVIRPPVPGLAGVRLPNVSLQERLGIEAQVVAIGPAHCVPEATSSIRAAASTPGAGAAPAPLASTSRTSQSSSKHRYRRTQSTSFRSSAPARQEALVLRRASAGRDESGTCAGDPTRGRRARRRRRAPRRLTPQTRALAVAERHPVADELLDPRPARGRMLRGCASSPSAFAHLPDQRADVKELGQIRHRVAIAESPPAPSRRTRRRRRGSDRSSGRSRLTCGCACAQAR